MDDIKLNQILSKQNVEVKMKFEFPDEKEQEIHIPINSADKVKADMNRYFVNVILSKIYGGINNVKKTYKKAKIVLNMIEEELYHKVTCDLDFYVECYQNCREQGFTIVARTIKGEYKKRRVTFSEGRTSEKIVVYLGNEAFRGITEKSYKTKRGFGDLDGPDYQRAVDYCVNYLLTGEVI